MRILPERVRNILGNPSPPPTVWEQQFDGDQAELESLVSRDWKEIKLKDLYIYFLDLNYYVELQPDLFRYLFPICLYRWYESLMQNEQDPLEESRLEEWLEQFHFAMGNGALLQSMTSPDEREAIYAFFHEALIERIEAERGFFKTGYPDYKWIFRLYDVGVFAPVIHQIWTTWWSLNSPGKAVSAIIYASSLVYLEGENQIFDPIFRRSAYGEPYTLCEGTGGYWLIENSQFLEKTLNVEYIQTKLIEAAERLSTEPEGDIAFQVAEDALKLERDEIIALRLAAVIATH